MIDRRSILLASAATALSSLWAPLKAQSPRIRHNVATSQGKAMLRIYADGVKAMKGLGGQNTRSWIFQWYVHATPVSKAQALSQVFGSTRGPAYDLANESWYTCQPHLGQATDYFLPWHRLYVLYLEEIVRNVTGRQEFTLPYWDYTTPASYALPDEFQTRFRTDPTFGTLFQSNRNRDNGVRYADVNAGQPLNKYFTGSSNFLVLPNLREPNYSVFCSQLNSNLHGAVHVFTGDTTNMGNVPTAANDPVFWMHHCNIDRIWSAWNAAGGKNPTSTNGKKWSDTKFVFVGGNGARVEVAISSVSDPSTLPYRYDNLPSPSGRAVARVAATASQGTMVLLRSKPPASAAPAGAPAAAPAGAAAAVALGAASQTVDLAPTAAQNRLQSIAPNLQAAGPSRLVLVLNGVRAQTDPNTVYKVYLDLPANAAPGAADQHYVGLLNFFGAIPTTEHAMHTGIDAEFDVTELVAQLKAQNQLANETSVTLVPVGAPADGSAPVVSGGIELQQR